ncbi:MAG: hypothetical protein LBD11_07900 [Candidatus Peribacteria bacterium]|jgi:hypothetical protein|nr:hypothetical protein [Candidatus Peribacteria bacterium]
MEELDRTGEGQVQIVETVEVVPVKLGFTPKPANVKIPVGRYDIPVGVMLSVFLQQMGVDVSQYSCITLHRPGGVTERFNLNQIQNLSLQRDDMVMFSREISGNN